LDETTWQEFLAYEHAVTEALKNQPIVALCSYCMEKCTADGVLEVMRSHGASLTKRQGCWDLIEIKNLCREPSNAEASGDTLAGTTYPPANSSAWSADLRELIEAELGVYLRECPERIVLKGGHVGLSASQATKLRTLMRELIKIAAKQGALCSAHGNLAVQWRVTVNGSRRLYLTWAESGLSGLGFPDKIGFGTRLQAGLLEKCMRVSEPTGMMCTFEMSLESDEGMTDTKSEAIR
jgi:hypothetical protein